MTEDAAAPGAPAEPAPAGAADAVVVRLSAGRFAIALSHVAEVGRLPRVSRVPGLPSWIPGVANWRGRILPTLDLRVLLGGESVPFGPAARLVVLATDLAGVGLLVDGVDGTTELGDDLAPFPAALRDSAGLVAGQLPRPDGPVAVLDVAAVMRLRDALPRARRTT